MPEPSTAEKRAIEAVRQITNSLAYDGLAIAAAHAAMQVGPDDERHALMTEAVATPGIVVDRLLDAQDLTEHLRAQLAELRSHFGHKHDETPS
jgi:hypothetical protein